MGCSTLRRITKYAMRRVVAAHLVLGLQLSLQLICLQLSLLLRLQLSLQLSLLLRLQISLGGISNRPYVIVYE